MSGCFGASGHGITKYPAFLGNMKNSHWGVSPQHNIDKQVYPTAIIMHVLLFGRLQWSLVETSVAQILGKGWFIIFLMMKNNLYLITMKDFNFKIKLFLWENYRIWLKLWSTRNYINVKLILFYENSWGSKVFLCLSVIITSIFNIQHLSIKNSLVKQH